MFVWQVVRAYPANQLGFWGKTGVYFSRWWEYLSDDPREANMEGGVFPAIVGTVLLTLIMILFAVPLGVIAAVYLREYAKQGWLVSLVRISVNNLAGVPSIVFGVFGLGFFCYLLGGSIDHLFFPERLPDPTVGKECADLGVAYLGAAHAPGSHRGDGRGVGGCSSLHARRCLRLRGEQVADDPPHRAATGTAGHYDGHDPGDRPWGRRGGPPDARRRGQAGPRTAAERSRPVLWHATAASCTWGFTFTTLDSKAATRKRRSRWSIPQRCC